MISEIFEKDNHSSNENKTKRANSDQVRLVESILGSHYDFLSVSKDKIVLIDAYNVNSLNFRAGGLFVKILNQKQFSPRVYAFPNLVEKMKDNGIPAIEFVDNALGNHVSEISMNGSKYYATVQPFVSGNHFTGSQKSLEGALEVLYKMEDSFIGMEPKACHQDPYYFFEPLERLERLYITYKNKIEVDGNDFYDDAFSTIFDDLLSICKFFVHYKVNLDNKNLRHFDLHPHNLLCLGDDLKAVLDLDNIAIADGKVATGFNMYKLGRKAISIKSITIQNFKDLTKEYCGSESLRPFVLIELLQRFLLVLESHYHDGSRIRDGDFFKYKIALKEIELMFD